MKKKLKVQEGIKQAEKCKARDTVMNWGELSGVMGKAHSKSDFPLSHYLVSDGEAVAEAQAGITWDIAFKAGQKAERERLFREIEAKAGTELRGSGLFQVVMTEKEWQALKGEADEQA